MSAAAVIIIVVVGFLVGGIMALRSSAKTGMPPPDVLDRATQRARKLDAAERESDRDR
jgi:hypothetical protein